MASNLLGEWKPRHLKYLCTDYASPIFKYLKPLLYGALTLNHRGIRSYWFGQPNN